MPGYAYAAPGEVRLRAGALMGNPEGCQKVAGGRSEAETPGAHGPAERTPDGVPESPPAPPRTPAQNRPAQQPRKIPRAAPHPDCLPRIAPIVSQAISANWPSATLFRNQVRSSAFTRQSPKRYRLKAELRAPLFGNHPFPLPASRSTLPPRLQQECI